MDSPPLYIIIPYRARGVNEFRKNQYDMLLPHLVNYLDGTPYTALVIEQNDDQPFNRGKLFNIGMLEAKKLCGSTEVGAAYFCHQNVDLIPTTVKYKHYGPGFTDIYGYPGGLGAMYFCDYASYETVNGYPNDLYGWGVDDTALMERCKLEHIPIDRSVYNNKSVIELDPALRHLIDGSHHDLNRKKVDTDLRNDLYKTNGLNSCEYSIASVEHKKELNCYHYLANL